MTFFILNNESWRLKDTLLSASHLITCAISRIVGLMLPTLP